MNSKQFDILEILYKVCD